MKTKFNILVLILIITSTITSFWLGSFCKVNTQFAHWAAAYPLFSCALLLLLYFRYKKSLLKTLLLLFFLGINVMLFDIFMFSAISNYIGGSLLPVFLPIGVMLFIYHQTEKRLSNTDDILLILATVLLPFSVVNILPRVLFLCILTAF